MLATKKPPNCGCQTWCIIQAVQRCCHLCQGNLDKILTNGNCELWDLLCQVYPSWKMHENADWLLNIFNLDEFSSTTQFDRHIAPTIEWFHACTFQSFMPFHYSFKPTQVRPFCSENSNRCFNFIYSCHDLHWGACRWAEAVDPATA